MPVFANLLLAIAGVVVAAFLLAPLAVRGRFWMNAQPRVEERSPEALPEEAAAYFAETATGFVGAGFELRAYLRLPDFVAGVETYLAHWTHPTAGQQAIAAVAYASAGDRTHVRRHVEFLTRCVPRPIILTNNARDIPHLPDPDADAMWSVPTDDVALLHRVHHLRERDLAIKSPPRYLPAPGEEAAYFAAMLGKEAARFEQAGVVAAGADGRRRLTLAGAYRLTWAEMPPFKGMALARARRRGRAALRRVASEAHVPPQFAPRITHHLPPGLGVDSPRR